MRDVEIDRTSQYIKLQSSQMFMAGQVSVGRKTGAGSVELGSGVDTGSCHETR